MSVSGRSDKSNYYLAGGYLDNNGIIRNTNVRQYDFRANFDHRTPSSSRSARRPPSEPQEPDDAGHRAGRHANATRATSMIRQILGSKPDVTTSGEDLGDVRGLQGHRPLAEQLRGRQRRVPSQRKPYADIRLTKWLFKTTFGTDYRNKNCTRFYGQYLDNGLNGRADSLGTGGFPLQRGQHVQHQQELQGRPPHRRRAGHLGQQRRKPQLDDQRAGLPRLPGPRIPLRRDQQRQTQVLDIPRTQAR